MSPTFRHRVEYAAFRVFRALLRLLPEAVAMSLGAGAGWVAGVLLGIRRDVVRANLARAFPDRSEAWRRGIAAASYRHLGREAVAAFRLSGLSGRQIVSRTTVRGIEPLARAVAEGRGAVMVTGHIGNWEIGGAALAARGLPVDAVGVRQRNRLFDEDLAGNRARLGMTVVPRREATRAMLRALGAGHVAGLAADQNAGPNGLFVEFFGVPASTARGPAVLALRTGAPVFVGVALRESSRTARYRLEIDEVTFDPTGDVEADVRRLTEAHTRALEAWIREAPEQYFWQHKRWKTRPPGEGRS